MRIAVSGAHHTGKTTLIETLIGSLPTFSLVDEPYYLLEEEGHVFAEVLGIEDFELQLERSIRSISESDVDCLFDRCPSDIMAYLTTHDESGNYDAEHWLPRARKAMQQLDIVFFIPIEYPDRIQLSATTETGFRQRVNEALQEIILEDQWGFGVPAIEVTGTSDERAQQVLTYIRKSA